MSDKNSKKSEKIVSLCEDMSNHKHSSKDYNKIIKEQKVSETPKKQ